jgi:hypothetical protein
MFVKFTLELSDQQTHLTQAVNKGYIRLKNILKRRLNEERMDGMLKSDVDMDKVVKMFYSEFLGHAIWSHRINPLKIRT